MNRKLLAGLALSVLAIGSAHAQPFNEPPPVGTVIGSVTGLAYTSTPNTFTTSFVASGTSTDFAIAQRNDPAFNYISNVLIYDSTDLSHTNLLTNGDFSGGTYVVGGTNQPNGWTYLNIYNAAYAGFVVGPGGCLTGTTYCYYDGSVQAYDAINQIITTLPGHTYDVSFLYAASGGPYSPDTYQPVSTNGDVTGIGGNGYDIYVYAGNSQPTAAPEPASLLLMFAGMFGIAAARRRRR